MVWLILRISRFLYQTETSMFGLKIYKDNTDQSKEENIKLYNNAQKWRSSYISNNGLSDNSRIRINVDAVLIDDKIIDEYDGHYQYYINIHKDRIILKDALTNGRFLEISSDGYVQIFFNSINYRKATNTYFMPIINIYTDNTEQSKANNIELYNNGQLCRRYYIQDNGLSDTGQEIRLNFDLLIIDDKIIDNPDLYCIDIYKKHIILLNNDSEILTIFSDGSVTRDNIQNLYNKFPSWTQVNMPGLKIYSDNTNQSKAENIKLYKNAIQWRKDHISYIGESDTGQEIRMWVDALIIDDETVSIYDGYYDYHIDIYNDRIILLNDRDSSEVLIISSDGSVDRYTQTPDYTPTLD